MWPVEPSQSDWFVREKIPLEIPNGPGAFWVAKAEALPAETQLSPTQIVWASGIQTWKRLAQRGVWVNGCAEGLGEQEDPCIGNLINAKLDWFKLTHASGANENGMRNLATYRLVPKSQNPDLTKQKYFFWLSGSAFERALALNPWLKEMTHFCGPGNTQQILARNGIEAFIFLDHAQWLEEMRLS
jgi:hydroxymethylbilane synthase